MAFSFGEKTYAIEMISCLWWKMWKEVLKSKKWIHRDD